MTSTDGQPEASGQVEEECQWCRFWRSSSPTNEFGSCRRRAPTPVMNLSLPRSHFDEETGTSSDVDREPIWPLLHFEQWCGEYEADKKRIAEAVALAAAEAGKVA